MCLFEFWAPGQIWESSFLQSPVLPGVHEGPISSVSFLLASPVPGTRSWPVRLPGSLQARLLSERSGPTSQALLRLSLEHVQFLGGVEFLAYVEVVVTQVCMMARTH